MQHQEARPVPGFLLSEQAFLKQGFAAES